MTDRKEEMINFALRIEEIVIEKKTSYIDAIVLYCEKTGLEVEVAAKLLSGNIKSKIRMEAEDLNLVEKSNTHRLPI
jgi:Phage late-transcription coactivator